MVAELPSLYLLLVWEQGVPYSRQWMFHVVMHELQLTVDEMKVTSAPTAAAAAAAVTEMHPLTC